MLVKPDSPFYKNPALWLVVLLPLTTVLVGIAFVVFSITHYDGVVDDDYYKKGKQINQTIERDETANQLGLTALIDLKIEKNLINMDLHSVEPIEFPDTVKLKFIHRTVSEQDLALDLVQQTEGRYLAVLPQLLKTNWQLELGTNDWRLRGHINYPQETEVSLSTRSSK